MDAIKWFLGALVVFAVGVVTVIIAGTLLPAGSEASTKGTYIPWLLTWGTVWMTAILAFAVAGFMVRVGLNKDAAAQ